MRESTALTGYRHPLPAPLLPLLHALRTLLPFPGEIASVLILVGLATVTLMMCRRAAPRPAAQQPTGPREYPSAPHAAVPRPRHPRPAARPLPPIRPLPALDALADAIGAATELGRPVHITTGVEDARSPQTIAAFPVVRRAAELCARYGTPLICTSSDPTVQAVNEEVVRHGYARAGYPERYNPDDVRYLSDSQFAYAGAVTGIFRRQRPAVNVMVGAFNAEAMVLIEAGAEVGALQIGATANIYQLPFIVAGCDYALIAEEMFAAAARLTGDPLQHASVVAQDWAKVALIATVLAGAAMALLAGGPR